MLQKSIQDGFRGAPVVSEMQVIPVAGRDSMLLNLSGADAPFFTRNIAPGTSPTPTCPELSVSITPYARRLTTHVN